MTEDTFSRSKSTFERVARAFWTGEALHRDGPQLKPWPGRSGLERFLMDDGQGGTLCISAEAAGRTLTDIEQEQLTLQTLQDHSFELAVPLVATKDEKPAFYCQGLYWTARRYVPVTSTFNWRFRQWDIDHCKLGGLTLARLHSIGDGANLSAAQKKRLKPQVDWRQQCLERLRLIFARASEFGVMPGHNLTVAAAEAMVGHLQGKVEQVAEVQAMIEQWLRAHGSKYAWQALIHGDFHPGNVLFAQDSVKAVIDWDFARLDDPLFDLAYARMMFCGTFREPDFSPDNLFDKTLCTAFEDSYRGFLDTSQNEHYLWLIVLCSLVIGDDASRQEEAVAADILSAYSEIVLALILIFELETLVRPCALSAEERGQESDEQRQERLQIERIVGNILNFFLRV
jgi:Ser/Thr protein kinase RdoA (MazF antagonist)